jgi:hypothetical protein
MNAGILDMPEDEFEVTWAHREFDRTAADRRMSDNFFFILLN